MVSYTTFKTFFCTIIIVGTEKGISGLHLDTGEGKRVFSVSEQWQHNEGLFTEAKEQVLAYCEGRLQQFSLPLDIHGTEFQKKVWKALQDIPFGEVRSYGQIATAIGNEKACRAVGMANSKNPIPLLIPCHRVVGANGSLTGFAHGISMKQRLLEFEGLKREAYCST